MTSVVYFVQAADGSVKIGTTRQLLLRQRNLASYVPGGVKLLCTVPGDGTLEAHYHATFAEDLISGEWYRPTPAILETVDRLARYGRLALPAGFLPQDGTKASAALADRRARIIERMAVLIRHCAAPAVDGESVANAIRRAAYRSSLSLGRTTSYWYRKVVEVPAEEAEAIRECALRYTDDPALLREELNRLVGGMTELGEAIDHHTLRDVAGREAGPGDSDD